MSLGTASPQFPNHLRTSASHGRNRGAPACLRLGPPSQAMVAQGGAFEIDKMQISILFDLGGVVGRGDLTYSRILEKVYR